MRSKRGVVGDVEVGVGLVRGLKEVLLLFKAIPKLKQGGRREEGRGGGSIRLALDKVQVTANDSGTRCVSCEHSLYKFSVVGKVAASLDSDIEHMKGVPSHNRAAAAKLYSPPSKDRERHV